jgi:sorting nexin-9/18/33
MAEMETYHSQKIEDFAMITKEYLDGEIGFYEQVIVYPSSSLLRAIS